MNSDMKSWLRFARPTQDRILLVIERGIPPDAIKGFVNAIANVTQLRTQSTLVKIGDDTTDAIEIFGPFNNFMVAYNYAHSMITLNFYTQGEKSSKITLGLYVYLGVK